MIPAHGRAPVELGWSQAGGCTICGSVEDCNPSHQLRSAFTERSDKPKEPRPVATDDVRAADRVFDPETGVLLYAVNEWVPHAEAVRLGLITVEQPTLPVVEPEATADQPSAGEVAQRRADAKANRQLTAPENRST